MSYRDILLLRKTSRSTSELMDKYNIKLYNRLKNTPVIFRNEHQFKTFVHNVSFGPFSHFQFKLPLKINHEYLLKFLQKYGNSINSLEVVKMHVIMNSEEKRFFEMMPNLRSLTVNYIKLLCSKRKLEAAQERKDVDNFSNVNFLDGSICMPTNFQNIRTLKFRWASHPDVGLILLSGCPNLTNISYGNHEIQLGINRTNTHPGLISSVLSNITTYLRNRSTRLIPTRNLTLNIPDFNCSFVGTDEIYNFMNIVVKENTQISVVPVRVLCSITHDHTPLSNQTTQRFFNQLAGIRGICPCLSSFNLNSLRELTLNLGSKELSAFKGQFTYPSSNMWSSLQSIIIKISLTQQEYFVFQEQIRDVWNYLFTVPRTNVRHVEIDINLEICIHPFYEMYRTLDPENMVNLDTLKLDIRNLNCDGYKKLIDMLGKHTRIKTLDLSAQCRVWNEYFVAEDASNPSFLNLKHLKHCTMRAFQPSATPSHFLELDLDDLHDDESQDFLSLVLPRSQLTCLTLSSDCGNLFKMTDDSIRRILTGNLGRTLRHISWKSGFDQNLDADTVYKKLKEKALRNKNMFANSGSQTCENCFEP